MHANQNLDLELIQKIHGLTADGITEYGLRTLAYDKAGNMATAWTEPIEFTFDLTGPSAAIPGCEATGTPPAGLRRRERHARRASRSGTPASTPASTR